MQNCSLCVRLFLLTMLREHPGHLHFSPLLIAAEKNISTAAAAP
jgi:hypothetical protein